MDALFLLFLFKSFCFKILIIIIIIMIIIIIIMTTIIIIISLYYYINFFPYFILFTHSRQMFLFSFYNQYQLRHYNQVIY